MMQHVAQRLVNDCAEFRSVQILDLARTRVEVFVENTVYWLIHYGKNSHKILAAHPKNLAWAQPTTVSKGGLYYYCTPYPW